MEFIIKGDFKKAQQELKKNNNNAVVEIFDKKTPIEGSLKDVVFTIKNNYAKNFSTTTGSSNLLENFNPGYNATILNKLFSEGAQLVATVNLDEFGLGGTGLYSNKGAIFHPNDANRLVGGSSSGSAATFTKFIGFAIGSDTGDSVRLPSSYIGKVGFKPSYGAVSRYGLFPYASSLDTVAWFTHNVNDSIRLAEVLYGKDKYDLTSLDIDIQNIKEEKPKKIAYLDCFELLEKHVLLTYKNVIKKLKKENIELIKIQPNEELLKVIKPVYDIISFAEASSNLSNLTGVHFGKRYEGKSWEETFKETRSKGFGFMVQRRLSLGSFYLEKDNQHKTFLKAQKVRRLISNWLTNIHNQCDIFIYPSSNDIAPEKNEKIEFNLNYMKYILTGSNLNGNPSISIKMGEYQNLPFNLTIDSKIYEDKKLLSNSLYIEKILKGENDD